MQESAYPEPSAKTGFAGNPLDRLSERRDDPTFVASLRRDPTTRLILFQRDVPVVRKVGPDHTAFFTYAAAARLGDPRDLALLGRTETGAIFAARLDMDAMIAESDAIVAVDLRTLALQGLLPAPQIGMLAQAKSLMHWHARHRFCANCGQMTELASAGWRRHCAACGA
ncbi:MAG TPA: NUDIX-like domain-containing protein, partial [Beijerinckiaceae bacterium]|nr:NUDIX-like domain-containing protein [Beijerinckiaceae bacterium]